MDFAPPAPPRQFLYTGLKLVYTFIFIVQLAAFNIQEALIWKEKIESVIDQVSKS